MSDRDQSPLLASVNHDAPEHGCEICAFGTRGDPGDLRDEASQPRAPVPGSTGEALACALMVAGTKPGPTRQMPCRGKLRHVGSDLGDECTCGYAVDARNGIEQGHLLGKLHGVALDFPLVHCDLGFQPLRLCQQPPEQKTMMVRHLAFQRKPQGCRLRPQPAASQPRQHLRIGLTLADVHEHSAA